VKRKTRTRQRICAPCCRNWSMLPLFYLAAAIAVVATGLALTRLHAVHGLLYLVVSLMAVALVFYVFGAPFVAALEVIVYAGAIMVLFIFVVMLLNLGPQTILKEKSWMGGKVWIGPVLLAAILLAEVVYLLLRSNQAASAAEVIGPKQVGIALYGPYLIGVELASFLLMAGMVGAYHLGRKSSEKREVGHGADSGALRAAPGGDPVRHGSGGASRPA
jgi:NADH-quinone oxidoreductase subunit J